MLYSRQQEALGAELEFVPVTAGRGAPVLDPVQPNPAKDKMTISYDLPEAGEATLALTDANGRVVRTETSFQSAGHHSVEWSLGVEKSHGLLFLRLETAGGTAVQRVMRIE